MGVAGQSLVRAGARVPVEDGVGYRRRALRARGSRAARPGGPSARAARTRRWSTATAKAAMAGASRVPDRTSRSWPPPWRTGVSPVRGSAMRAPDAERAADLVAADRHRVGSQRAEVDGKVAEGLHRVGVEGDPGLAAHGRDLVDRLNGPDLVVRPHDGAQRDGIRIGEPLRHGVEVDASECVHGQPGDLGLLLLRQPHDRVEDGVVLDGRGEDAPGTVSASPRPVQALHREVVRLRAAGREHDGAGADSEQRGDRLARLLDHPAGLAPGRMERRGVAELRRLRDPFIADSREHRRRRRMVQIRPVVHDGQA